MAFRQVGEAETAMGQRSVVVQLAKQGLPLPFDGRAEQRRRLLRGSPQAQTKANALGSEADKELGPARRSPGRQNAIHNVEL